MKKYHTRHSKKYAARAPNINSQIHFKPVDFEVIKLQQLKTQVIEKHLLPFSSEVLSFEILQSMLPSEKDENNLFTPWLLFDWQPPIENTSLNSKMTLAQHYLKWYPEKLSEKEVAFMMVMLKSYDSFYSVMDLEEGRILFVKDLLLGTTHLVKEEALSYLVKAGDIVFGRLCALGRQTIFIELPPCVFSSKSQAEIQGFQKNHEILTPLLLKQELSASLHQIFFKLLASCHRKSV